MCTIKDNVHQGLLDTQCIVEETLILFFCAKHQAFWESHQFFFSLAASFLFHFSSSDDFVLLLIPFNLQAIEFTPRLLFFAMLRNLRLSLLGVSFLCCILHVYWLYCWHFDICSYCKFLTHLLELQVTYTGTYAFDITMYHFTTVVIYNCRMQFYIGSVWLPRSWECLWILPLLFLFFFFPLSFSLTSSLAVFFLVLSYHVNGSFVLGLRVECYRGSWVGGVGWSIREAKIDRTLLAWTLHGSCQSCQLPPQAHPSKLSFPSAVFLGGR